MKLKNVIQTKLAKTLVAALMIGSISNTGFTVQAEEATQNEQNDVVEMASVSGNDSVVAVKEKTYPTIKTVILAGGTMAKYVGGQVLSLIHIFQSERHHYPSMTDADIWLWQTHQKYRFLWPVSADPAGRHPAR